MFDFLHSYYLTIELRFLESEIFDIYMATILNLPN